MSQRNLALVVLWMSGALFSFTVSAVVVRVLRPTLAIFEMLAIRSFLGIAILLAAAWIWPSLRPGLRLRRPLLHLLRNVPHVLGQAGWAYGITILPFATVFALEFTSPVWLAILAVIFLGERLSVPRIGAVLLGLAGVMVVLRPGLVTLQPASLAVLAAAFSFALTGVVTKALTATQSTFAILFWMNVIQLPLNLAASDPLFVTRIEPWQIWGALGAGVSGVTSHLCLTQAYRHGDATLVIPLDFLRIPLIAAIGWLFYGERLDVMVFLGAGIIVSGILWSLLAEARRPAVATGGGAAIADATSSRRPG